MPYESLRSCAADDDDERGTNGALGEMSPLCPLDDEHLPLIVDSLKGKQVQEGALPE